MAGGQPIISVENLWFKYIGSNDWVLKDISFEVREGETAVIMGPSGCGKSTLLYALIGMIPHVMRGELRGKVSVAGFDVRNTRPEQLARHVGFVFQNPEIQIITPSVIEEVIFGLENLGLEPAEIERRTREALELTGLAGKAHAETASLSPGEKQVLAIASVLALRPRILVLDEPTSMLDHPGTTRVLGLIDRIRKETGLTLLIVEHRIEWIAERADKVIIMDDGRIVASGRPKEIFGTKEVVEKTGVRPPQVSEIFYKIIEERPSVASSAPITLAEALGLLRGLIKGRGAPPAQAGRGERKGRAVIEVRDLWFRYRKDLPWVLRGISLEVREGELLAIIGHSGAGKTTLVKHFNGLLKPTRGQVVVLGRDTRKATVSELARDVGMVFQNPEAQFFASTIRDEISLALRERKLGKEEIEARIEESMNAVDLHKDLNTSPHLLSFGEKHRLAIASILALRPRIVILDEPFSGLDYKRSLQLLEVMRKFVDAGGTAVLIAHDLQLIGEVADRVAVLLEGRIVREGPTDDVLSDVDWLKEHGFMPLQSAVLAREVGLRGLVRTRDVAKAILEAM
ncbi:MAG: energy-coupling factor transporter ATPase [Desulfurococcaceae archaeon]